MARRDTQYLEQMSGGGWRVVVDVPRNLHKAVGKTKLKEALRTDSLVTANALKHGVVARLKASLDQHRTGTPTDPLLQEAMALRAALEAAGRRAGPFDNPDVDAIKDAVKLRADQIQGPDIGGREGEPEYEPIREAQAEAFAGIALGHATPLDLPLPTFLLEKKRWGPRTVADFQRALGYLKVWLRENHHQSAVEAVTRRSCGQFCQRPLGWLEPIQQVDQQICHRPFRLLEVAGDQGLCRRECLDPATRRKGTPG